jgi:transcriptional regulator GlxA family with amidase domain
MEMSIVIAKDMFYAGSLARHPAGNSCQLDVKQDVVVASENGQSIKTFNGSDYRVDVSVEDIETTDLIIVSGVWGDIDDLIANSSTLISWLNEQFNKGTKIACLHTGTFIVAETGLLDGKVATIYWRMVEEFKTRYPQIILQPEKSLTTTGQIYCSSGVASAIEMAIYLLEKMWGLDVAEKVSRHFLMDIPKLETPLKLALAKQKEHEDTRIHTAQQWIETNFSHHFLLDEVAEKVGMQMRNFRRNFKAKTGDTPMQYLHRVRLANASHLLSTSNLTVEQIAYRVGYNDANYFSRLFKRKLGFTPSDFRENK